MSSATDYSEAGERNRVAGQPLSHLSIEVGHFYMDELVNGVDRIHAQLRKVAPIVADQIAAAEREFGPGARVSTCFLVDDYFWNRTGARSREARRTADPREVLPKLLEAAQTCGVPIDYLAREAGCAEVPSFLDGEPVGAPVRLAEMIAARIVPEPEREGTGRRPPTVESGWLCNGRRSSEYDAGQAMRIARYRPPEEFGARNHSIFLDVQLWSRQLEEVAGEQVERILWSCPFLASIWQLLRLGLIRDEGAMVAAPVPWPDPWPSDWSRLPAVVQLNPDAKPFAAYRALSILPYGYLGIEHAVRVILDHLQLDEDVQAKLVERGASERNPVAVPRLATRRLNHIFLGDV
ncbi:SCO2522 family protein [Nocardia sp. CDC153]|uniref:SCO2522 family protein n=1 Tax=Nocardia sp. CDC153 TaxID=3112167 RepID=UPI002DBC347A|nr:SCO2522 family protein [Nocardia sp. CDC153]MEC3958127.1 SCO2522 family protein [Nocardia sp. CDC153]